MDIARRELLLSALSLGAGALSWGTLAAPTLSGRLWAGQGGAGQGGASQREVGGPDSSLTHALAEARIHPWEGGAQEEILNLRQMNPEYDLLARAFTALGLTDLALHDPARWLSRTVAALDAMAEDAADAVATHGPAWFLLPYWGYRDSRGERRSLFVDSEILLIRALRRLLAEDAEHAVASRALAAGVVRCLGAAPAGMAESYPDECWVFDHTLTLAALRLMIELDGARPEAADWEAARDRWLVTAHTRLIDAESGLIVSATDYGGRVVQAPEGSTLWFAATMLRLVDPTLAEQQYRLTRRVLGRAPLGFGFAREWPRGQGVAGDIDSGPIVPVLGASPSSSGMAILAARSFGDHEFAEALATSLRLAAGPREEEGRLRYRASNTLGDAVIFAGMSAGPLWERLGAGGAA